MISLNIKNILLSTAFLGIIFTSTLIYLTVKTCYSSEIFTKREFSNPSFSPDGNSIAFASLKLQYRKPQGICTFPNGGVYRKLNQVVQVYTINRTDLKIIKVAESEVPTAYNFLDYFVDGFYWENDGMKLVMRNGTTTYMKRYFYEVKNSEVIETNDFYNIVGRAKLNSANPAEWGNYEYDLGMVSYIGGD